MDAQEAEFYRHAQAANLTRTQADVAWGWISGAPVGKLARIYSLQRTQVFQALREATAALAQVAPDFFAEGREFPRSLIRAIDNKPDHRSDEGLSGVAPAYDVRTHLPKAEVFSADRWEIRQSPEWCLKHWGRSLSAAPT